MIGGFVITGSVAKRVLVRAVGPSLTSRGIGATEVLLDPTIEVHKGAPVIASNDNWGDNANVAEITAVAAQIGAFALDSGDIKSSALLLNLQPGVYSFVANGKAGTSGIVLLEVYDADLTPNGSKFVNISTRAYATTGDGVTIGGFVISGRDSKQILLRAVGPTLTKSGISQNDVLVDPSIELHDARNGNATIAVNDDWGQNQNAASIVATGSRIGAMPLDAGDTKSSALLLELEPGVYSFIASGKSGNSGVVLVEVYDAE
jgi:predicted dinucleotide-binding enzyme